MTQKIEIIISLVLALALFIAVPTFAWFNGQTQMAKLAKIKAPDDLYINAAHREDKIYLDMKSIDVTKKFKNSSNEDQFVTSKNFVFSISGNYVNSFTLQMEHTTNNPYSYTICEGTIYKAYMNANGTLQKTTYIDNGEEREVDKILNINTGKTIAEEHSDYATLNLDGSPKYVEYIATNSFDAEEASKVTFPSETITITAGDTLYIYVGSEITNKAGAHGSYLNKTDGARTANSSLTGKSYGSYENYNIYVNPVFWQLKGIEGGATKGQPFYKTYVINVSWTGINNISSYDKETDIMYISVFVE